MAEQRPGWAERIRAARRSRLYSQKELAKALYDAADERTRTHLPTRESLTRQIRTWEAGQHHPGDPYRQLLHRVLDIDLDVAVREYPVVGQSQAGRVGDTDLVDALGHQCRADLVPSERDAHTESRGVAVDEQFLETATYMALAQSGDLRIGDGPGRVGHRHVSQVEEATSSFRYWDNQYGGGLWRTAVVGLLSDLEGLLAGPFVDERIGRQMFAAVADLAQLAGWMSFDLRLDATAQRYFVLGLRLAKETGDRAQVARMLYCLARQLIECDPRASLDLVQTALFATRRIDIPRVTAMLRGMEGRAYACMGAATECQCSLAMAETAFSRADTHTDPGWAEFFSAAELAGMTGAALRDLALCDDGRARVHATRARPWLEQATEGRPDDYLRSRVLDFDGLAVRTCC